MKQSKTSSRMLAYASFAVFILATIIALNFLAKAQGAVPSQKSVDAAGYQNALADGTLATVFGSGFPSGTSINQAAPGFPLPVILSGVSVLADGTPTPLLYVNVQASSGAYQINYQLPWESDSNVRIAVTYFGQEISSERVRPVRGAPGLFSVDATGKSQLVAQNLGADGTYTANDADHAAPQGSILILYGTGTGQTTNGETGLPARPETGMPTPATPLFFALPTKVVIGGVEGEVLFSGLCGGFVSTWQINVRLGAGTPSGPAIPVTVNYAGKSTVAGGTVAVAPDPSPTAPSPALP